MDLLRRRVLRAASLVLLLGALASPAYAGPALPIVTWNAGDPDVGGGSINSLRILHHVLVMSGRRMLNPAAPVVAPLPTCRLSSYGSKR